MATFSDDFQRADDSTGLGANWDFQRDSTHQSGISSGTSIPEITQSACLMAVKSSVLTPANDQFAEVVIATLNDGGSTSYSGVSVLCRCAAPGTRNYYRFLASSASIGAGTTDIQSTNAGTGTSIGSNSTAWAATDTLRGECSSNQISLKKNGSTVLGPITNSDWTSGFVGLANYLNISSMALTDSAIESFNGGDLAVSDTLFAQASM
jgi:hypothetical protein